MPFSAWLPAAMAAPTPVSALVHSSTLVTAGVYVLIRFYSSLPDSALDFLFVVSRLTLLMSGMRAIMEVDFKKIIAFSTLRQLRLMVVSLSVGALDACFFHLIVHALFKALMFMCVGYLIVEFSGAQDFRFFSSCWCGSPYVSGWLLVSCASLFGVPYVAGYYSKDLVIESYLEGGAGVLEMFVLLVGVSLTVGYGVRIVLSCFSEGVIVTNMMSNHLRVYVWFPIRALGLARVISGFFLTRVLVELNSPLILTWWNKMFCLVLGLVGGLLGVCFYRYPIISSGGDTKRKSGTFFVEFLRKIIFLPVVSRKALSRGVLGVSTKLSRFVDSG